MTLTLNATLVEAHSQALTIVPTLAITTAEDYQDVGAWLVKIKTLRRQIATTFRPIIEAAFRTHREAVKQCRTLDTPLADAEDKLKGLIAAWDEAETIRRTEADHQRMVEATRAAEDRQLAEADALDALGEKELAQAVLNEPVVPLVALAEEAVKAEGVSTRQVWRYRITDQALIPDEYWMVDETKLAKVVRAMGNTCTIAGIQIYAETVVSARTTT